MLPDRHAHATARHHAEYLVRAGFAVLAIDYRTIGFSEGQFRGQVFPERYGGWGMGMAVRPYRGDYPTQRSVRLGQRKRHHDVRRPGQSAPARPSRAVDPAPGRLIHGFWTTLYQAIDTDR
jgi:hypothetical protein